MSPSLIAASFALNCTTGAIREATVRALCYDAAVKITQRLAEFVACTPSGDIPAEAREQARRAFLDTLGVTLAGCREDAGRVAAEIAREQGGVEEASVLGHCFRAPASEAALVNGSSGHALDFDDVSMSMRGHPSVPLVPAVLALGEKLGASGRDVIDAFILGFEVECKIGRLIGAPHYALGWHPTATFGTLGAAAACSRLLRLGPDRTRMALGIAASLASGARRNFGSMTKPLHAGWAARNGVVAASLASRGFTADDEALEAPDGWLHAASGGAPVDSSPIRRLGAPWEIVSPGIGVKLYPCCYFTHLAIDAALEIRPQVAPHCREIESVRVSVSPGTMMVLRKEPPQSGLEGKFSMEYVVAAALVDGEVTLASFAYDAVARPAVRHVMDRVRVTEDGPPSNAPIGGSAVIEIAFPDRDTLTSPRAQVPRGDPQNPLSWAQLASKFRVCARPVLEADQIERAIGIIETMDDLTDIRELTGTLTATC
jgi:2-methylcitrate dehydratase PrpD